MNSMLPPAIGLIALLYASVGHAGATGYIAVMTLFGLPAETIRPTALMLNVIAATVATAQFFRAGHFRPRLFWPLAAASVPCAFVGGAITLPTTVLEATLGGVLLVSAGRILWDLRRDMTDTGGPGDASVDRSPVSATTRSPPLLAALGGAVGLLSGLTGIGGGVFLTPTLLVMAAAPVRTIAAVTAPFILVNSLAGLAGGLLAGRPVPAAGVPLVAAAALGAAVGSHLGAFRLPVPALRLLMAGVLLLASLKLLGRPLGL